DAQHHGDHHLDQAEAGRRSPHGRLAAITTAHMLALVTRVRLAPPPTLPPRLSFQYTVITQAPGQPEISPQVEPPPPMLACSEFTQLSRSFAARPVAPVAAHILAVL